jgi:polygalacturonase
MRCDTTTVNNVTIYGDFNIPNNDAIDIDGSNNTVVRGCHISTGDDGVCAKTKAGPTFNLSASECW